MFIDSSVCPIDRLARQPDSQPEETDMRDNTAFGYPIATLENLHEVLTNLKIERWNSIAPTVLLEDYLKRDLSPEDRTDLRYVPKTEVLFLENPHTKERFTAFRNTGKPWVTVFAVIPHEGQLLVPVTVEFKQGFGEVVLVPPSGVKSRTDHSFADTARREFEEETGFKLDHVIPLAGGIMQGATVRQNTGGIHPFLGILKDPIQRGPSKLDHHELLRIILFPLDEWQKVVLSGLTYDMASTVVTYHALALLRTMGMVK